MQNAIDDHARDWLHARKVIADALTEICEKCAIRMTRETHEANAAAVIARLASADPPLILTRFEEPKE